MSAAAAWLSRWRLRLLALFYFVTGLCRNLHPRTGVRRSVFAIPH